MIFLFLPFWVVATNLVISKTKSRLPHKISFCRDYGTIHTSKSRHPDYSYTRGSTGKIWGNWVTLLLDRHKLTIGTALEVAFAATVLYSGGSRILGVWRCACMYVCLLLEYLNVWPPIIHHPPSVGPYLNKSQLENSPTECSTAEDRRVLSSAS